MNICLALWNKTVNCQQKLTILLIRTVHSQERNITLNRLDELKAEKDLETNILQFMICTPLISQQIT